MDTHIKDSHPDYVEWGHRWRRWARFVMGSCAALVIGDLLYLRSLDQIFQYVVPAYLFGALFLLIWQLVRKQRWFRDDWKKGHPLH